MKHHSIDIRLTTLIRPLQSRPDFQAEISAAFSVHRLYATSSDQKLPVTRKFPYTNISLHGRRGIGEKFLSKGVTGKFPSNLCREISLYMGGGGKFPCTWGVEGNFPPGGLQGIFPPTLAGKFPCKGGGGVGGKFPSKPPALAPGSQSQ